MAEITFDRLNKVYAGKPPFHAIRDVSLHIDQGEFVVFVGPSGCGKSTLLRMVAGLENVTGGDLLFNGQVVNDLNPKERGIGMVFQSYALYPHMTVYDNIAFGLRLTKMPAAGIDEKVNQVAAILQLGHLLDRKPEALSGGQRQRVAIGRAIAREPAVFLFDEPLSNLDAALRVQMRVEIARLHKQLGVTMIYVTHDQAEAMTLADKIVVLNGGEISQVGSPMDIYDEPADVFVASFIGSPKMNLLPVTLSMSAEGGASVTLRSGQTTTVTRALLGGPDSINGELGIRPQHFALDSRPGALTIEGEVIVVEELGNETLGYLETAECDEPVVISLPGSHPLREGECLPISVSPADCHLFDNKGFAVPRT